MLLIVRIVLEFSTCDFYVFWRITGIAGHKITLWPADSSILQRNIPQKDTMGTDKDPEW